MRCLKNLDNFRIRAGRLIFKKLLIERSIRIRKFSFPVQLPDRFYFIKIWFEGHLIIKNHFYEFEFSMDLVTDNILDVQVDVPRDLDNILNMVKSDFISDDSKLLKKIINSIITIYSDEMEFLAL